MSRADRALRLISQIAAEKVRKSRTPRRGIATYRTGSGVDLGMETGSAGEFASGSATPPFNTPYAGRPVMPLKEGSTLIKTWPSDDDREVASSLGKELPAKQEDRFIPNEIFGDI